MRRAAAAVLLGLAAVTALLLAFPPGAFDAAAGDVTGTMGHDEGYWPAPARERAGETRFDRYDRERATALALPENAACALAYALGVPSGAARNAGSILAAFALGALLALAGPAGRLSLLAFLLAPPIFGHLRSDLGEGPTLAIGAWWVFAATRGRLGLAAFLAGIGLFQKGCGLFLGVGVLVGVLAAGPGVLRRLARAAAFASLGVAACAALAVLLFHDRALSFVARPFVAADEFWVAPSPSSVAVQAAFPGYHLFGPTLALAFVGVALLAGRLRPGAAVVAAAAAGLLYRGIFAANWRFVPVLPLLLLPALAPPAPGPGSTRSGVLLGLLVLPQAVGSCAAWMGLSPGALGLALGTAIAAGPLVLLWRRGPSHLLAGAGALALLAASVAGPVRAARDPESRSTALHDLAALVAQRVPSDAYLLGQPVLSLARRGDFALAPFERFWHEDLAAMRPRIVARVRAVESPGGPPARPPLAGYRLASSEALGRHPYAPSSTERDLVLDLWERDGGH